MLRTIKPQPKKPKNQCSPALKPRLRLFLSVDLVGSTAFKQARPPELLAKETPSEATSLGPAWFKSILSFYRDFETMLRNQWLSYNLNCADLKLPPVVEPEFWKSNGDELLYTFELSDPRAAAGVLLLWVKTIESYRKALRSNTPQLDVKSAAWVAGFPVMNSEVIFRQEIGAAEDKDSEEPLVRQIELLNLWYSSPRKRLGLTKDYVGPSIDTGFRISTWASPRRFVIAIDLALLITGVSIDHEIQESFKLYFEGSHPLKGVVGGRPYPIIWVAVGGLGPLVEKEDQLLGRVPVDHSQVKAYAEEYIRANSDFLMRPFIHECGDQFFEVIPKGYFDHIHRWESIFSDEKKLAKSQAESLDPAAKADGKELDLATVREFAGSLPTEKDDDLIG